MVCQTHKCIPVLLVALVFCSCKDPVDIDQKIDEAVDYLNNQKVILQAIGPGEGWIEAKDNLGLPYSSVDQSTFMEITDQHYIYFYNTIDDCHYEDSGIKLHQYSQDHFVSVGFSNITEISEFEREIDDRTVYYMVLTLDREFLIFSDWSDCQDGQLPLLPRSDRISNRVSFVFTSSEDRQQYKKHVDLLRSIPY